MNTIALPGESSFPEQLEHIKEYMGVLGVAVLMGGGPSVIYATQVVEALEQFENGTRQGGRSNTI